MESLFESLPIQVDLRNPDHLALIDETVSTLVSRHGSM